MDNRTKKATLRTQLKNLREQLSDERRKEASEKMTQYILTFLPEKGTVMSFMSFGSEINTHNLNQQLALSKRLLLPRSIDGQGIVVHKVPSINDEFLSPSKLGILEPSPEKCPQISFNDVDYILVPALGFDKINYRIGWGKGLYDMFLALVPHTSTYGIGFQEQLVDELPRDQHDIPLDEVFLF